MLFAVRWFPALAWAAVIFWLSSQSNPPGSGLAPDFVGHFVVYAGLTAALIWGWTNRFTSGLSRAGLLAMVALSTAYGASDEFHQSFVPLRDVSAKDLSVDFLAAVITACAFYFLLGKRESRRS